ncbi:MAG TPA: hypothetical protein EYP17_09945 [Candidatus Latescibacteria bacterium]|nr:hypothetical protein [Candidatus Latescibacterota bacterium]
MAIAGKKVLIVVPPEFQDREYERVRRLLEAQGAKITVASLYPGQVRGEKGLMAKAEVAVSDVKYYDYDGLVFIGGEGARKFFFDDEKVLKLAKDAKYKPMGALSTAVGIFAYAEVLKGKKATGSRNLVRMVEALGAKYTGEPVCVDDKLVTAVGPDDAERFTNAFAETLAK